MSDEIADFFTSGKSFDGFDRVQDRRWVSEPFNHIRKLFEITAMKGGMYSTRWGWSVDFIPLLKGKKLTWKRTTSKADFDLCIDPIDASGKILEWCSFSKSSASTQIAKVGIASFDAATKDFKRVQSLSELANLFQERSTMEFKRFSLKNYVQTDLAWGLLLLSLRQEQKGLQHLSEFCNDYRIDRATTILRKAENEARLQNTETQ